MRVGNRVAGGAATHPDGRGRLRCADRHVGGTGNALNAPRTTFVAARLDDAARAAVGSLTASASAALTGARWVPVDGLHVTVCFLGAHVPADWPPIVDTLAPAVALCDGPVRLGLGGGGQFPDDGSARVLWLGVSHGGGLLAELAAACAGAARDAGLHPDDRPYRPHCTVARSRSTTVGAGATWARMAAAAPAMPTWSCAALALMAGRPGMPGSYEMVAELPLGPVVSPW